VLATLGEFFIMGWIPWPLKAVMVVADAFHINLGSILKNIWAKLEPMIKGGKQLNYDEVKSIVENEARAAGGEPAEDSSNSDDMLYALRKIESDGRLVRTARGGRDTFYESLANVFKTHGPKVGKWTTFGFLWFIIKTILIGGGLLTAGSAVTKHLGVGDKKEQRPSGAAAYPGEEKPSSQVNESQYSVKPLPWVPPAVPNSLTNTGNGQTHFTNDGISKTWSVPLKGDLKSTMALWAGYVYKELEGQGELLNSIPAFNIMVSNLNNYIDRSYLLVPPNFHSLKEIVDTFAGQAARKLGKPKESVEHEAA